MPRWRSRLWAAVMRSFPIIFLWALVINLMAVGLAPFVQAEPASGDSFSYEYKQKVSHGSGGYYGWWEKTVSSGTYRVISSAGGKVEMAASYSWYYDASDAPRTSLTPVNLNFSYSTVDRQYIYGFDLDVDYGPSPSVWFWIPTDVVVGQQIRVLDSVFTVESLDATIWSGSLPRKAILIVEHGGGYRNDEYGSMQFTFTDKYYMDRDTGYIIAERYSEHDAGTWSGYASSFDWTEDFDVVSSTYEIPIDWTALALAVLLILTIPGIIYLAYYAFRWRTRKFDRKEFDQVKIYRVRKMEKYPHLPDRASINFGPFLEDFVRKALLSGGRVAVAESDDGLEGLAIYHKDAKVGAIFCKDYMVNEALRRYIGAKDFFSEVKRELGPPSGYSTTRNANQAYNIHETSRVLKLNEPPETGYDTANFRVMRPEDFDAVAALARGVYKVRAKRWMRSLIDTGDLGVVALVDGRIVGFAFATIIDDRARFHTLTVAPKMRGRGIAKELMRARLHLARKLGVHEIILEIADWNLPSLTVSASFDFKNIGTMYIETTRRRRVKNNIVRRW